MTNDSLGPAPHAALGPLPRPANGSAGRCFFSPARRGLPYFPSPTRRRRSGVGALSRAAPAGRDQVSPMRGAGAGAGGTAEPAQSSVNGSDGRRRRVGGRPRPLPAAGVSPARARKAARPVRGTRQRGLAGAPSQEARQCLRLGSWCLVELTQRSGLAGEHAFCESIGWDIADPKSRPARTGSDASHIVADGASRRDGGRAISPAGRPASEARFGHSGLDALVG